MKTIGFLGEDKDPVRAALLKAFKPDIKSYATRDDKAANALFGEGTAETRTWFQAARKALREDGWYGIQEHIGRTLCGTVSDAGRTAIDRLVAYSANHSQRLDYRHRLACGEPIGSGLIEGACKQVIGKRMKQTGARWTVANANRMAELCCLTYSDQWAEYWNAA